MQVSSGSSLYPNIKTGRLPSSVNGKAMTPFRTDFAVLKNDLFAQIYVGDFSTLIPNKIHSLTHGGFQISDLMEALQGQFSFILRDETSLFLLCSSHLTDIFL